MLTSAPHNTAAPVTSTTTVWPVCSSGPANGTRQLENVRVKYTPQDLTVRVHRMSE